MKNYKKNTRRPSSGSVSVDLIQALYPPGLKLNIRTTSWLLGPLAA